MNTQELYSIYSSNIGHELLLESPLYSITPPNLERGWHVSRNLRKPLNHLEFLKDQEDKARRLNLHSLLTPELLFEENYALLELHQAKKISTDAVIDHLTRQIQQHAVPLSRCEVVELLRELAIIRHMEFHPTDLCNLSCKGCTYGHDDPELKPPPVQFPFDKIERIALLQPRSMVVIGGGEPTLYKDPKNKYRFQEMVEEVRRANPGIKLALVSNGTFKPPGNWPCAFSWIRLSLDAATRETYRRFRGKPMFDRVIEVFLAYLDTDVPYVGISFLFAKTNVHEYAEVARFIHELVKRERPHALHKVNIQYRPLRRDPYQYDRPFTEAVGEEAIDRVVCDLKELAGSSKEMASFLRNQTNATAILGGNSHPAHEFKRCYYSRTFCIVRANGELRPCFIRVQEPDFVLGNIGTDRLETIALNALFIGAIRKRHCDPHGCRQCHVNYMFEQGLSGAIKPSTSPEVLSYPMY